ncbi:MAG: diacylglycerol/lipid kinase family protein [Catenisphaera adipataccumulans]|uniref:diacylglycerol/lipid kinase family protein n=1 Tax=Catenisphaera adipataccumulans TaxID=700500 RepID=UPI003D8DD616
MKEVFLINPHTDAKKLYALMEEIKKNFKGRQVIIEKTKAPKHAEYIAKKYALFENEPVHLYVCGGDGLLHETINGLIDARSEVHVSVLPLGTANDFVKTFRPWTTADFLNLANYKNPIAMDCDVMSVNGEYAINTVSFGFDVYVAQYANHMKSRLPVQGIIPYYTGMLQTLRRPLGQEYRMQIDDQRMPAAIYDFVVFCNGKYYGGGYQPCPDAMINDGVIDICLISGLKKRDIVYFAKAYEKGEHVSHTDRVTIKQAHIIHMDTNNETIYGNLDGEVRAFKNPTIELKSHAIHLWLPNVGE